MTAPTICPGCDEPRHVRPYQVRFLPRSPEEGLPPIGMVWYCDDCAELAELPDGGWSGEIMMIHPLLDERDALEVQTFKSYVRQGLGRAQALRVARNSMRY